MSMAFNQQVVNASAVLQMHEQGIKPGDSIELILYEDAEFYEIPVPEQMKGFRGSFRPTYKLGKKCTGIIDHYDIYPALGMETAETPLVPRRPYRVFLTEGWDSQRKES